MVGWIWGRVGVVALVSGEGWCRELHWGRGYTMWSVDTSSGAWKGREDGSRWGWCSGAWGCGGRCGGRGRVLTLVWWVDQMGRWAVFERER